LGCLESRDGCGEDGGGGVEGTLTTGPDFEVMVLRASRTQSEESMKGKLEFNIGSESALRAMKGRDCLMGYGFPVPGSYETWHEPNTPLRHTSLFGQESAAWIQFVLYPQ
jgi:hypothetical protein